MITNSRGHLDARNVLGVWSFVKWILDSAFIVAGCIVGGGVFFHKLQIPAELGPAAVLALALYGWAFFKELIDTPLVIIWSIGKVKHIARTQKRHVITWLLKKLITKKRGRPRKPVFIFSMARAKRKK